ncbi:RNA polymerase sigma factor [Chitinophaga sp. GCM10012297]|uniref:RNA polymerase sigma-70 factor n=1 Tax=Chitinophaga chungangae TaxID=2821488 RepID=A0ABS3Y7W6_9BACT|nr:RNA polymerase sigma-70 factor [Chitinophaga chungangae]MBO9150768.1 RNA polymerase sigma-70 factor [Chitinophaga chungangae]
MPINQSYNEKELLEHIATGDEQAFAVIFNKYWPAVYSAALVIAKSPALAEDISQEVFTRLWETKEKARNIGNVKAFLFIAARNLIINRLSRQKVEEAYRAYQLHHSPGTSGEEHDLDYQQLEQRLRTAIERLPPRQQRAFLLSREQGLTYEQIAEQMQISRDTVKEHIIKALASLRKSLHEHDALILLLLLEFYFS